MQMEIHWLADTKTINKLILIVLICLPICFWLIPFSFIEHRSFCIFVHLFGKQCIGCGTTRAMHSVIHFKFYEAFGYNKFIVITFPIVAFEYLKLIAIYYKKSFIKINGRDKV